MKQYILFFLLLIGIGTLQSQVCFDPAQTLEQYYIVGNSVNVRKAPSLEAKVIRQVNWGTTFAVIETKDSWRKVLSADESDCFYVHADYLCDTTTFIHLATAQTEKTPRMYYELLQLFDAPQYKEQQEVLALELLKARKDARTIIRLEACEDVNYIAYQILAKRYLETDRWSRLRALRAISLQTAAWVRLDLAKTAIRGNRLEEAERFLMEIFQSDAKHLRIDPGCEYDLQQRIQPILDLEEHCQALYWSLDEEKAAAFLTFLEQVGSYHADEGHRAIATKVATLIKTQEQ